MKKLARFVAVSLLAAPFVMLSGCCNKCKHHHHAHKHHVVEQMQKECGGK
ncbi:MAG: hypothetical protein RLZ35_92 [Pseudomonadota bacterium]|jgi:hypothetical protein